ncbi:MAG: MarR family winged helix-turn-helix transcriptional regulator [Burkholderiales bacterium]
MKLISTPRKTATDAAARRAKAHAKQVELGEHTSLWSRSGFLVRRLHQIHVAMFKDELAAYHVTPVQYGLLSILVDMPGIDQFSLAEELGIDRANVHDVLKRLESRKLLIRVVDPHNRRRKLCLTTKQGAELVARHQTGMQKAQRRLLDPLTVAERATFLDLLLKLVNANNDFGRTVLSSSRSKPVRSSPPKVVPISHSKGER